MAQGKTAIPEGYLPTLHQGHPAVSGTNNVLHMLHSGRGVVPRNPQEIRLGISLPIKENVE